MTDNNLKNYAKQIVHRNGKTYVSLMYWYAGGTASDRQLSETSTTQKDVLYDLLLKMRETSKITPTTDSYRQYADTKKTYTIVENKIGRCNYRIDNQTRVNFDDPDPRLNIHYQIGDNSHAMVLVRMRPIECPPDITVGLIDTDPTFGFSPRTVMGFIEDALRHSADNKCYTYIEWTITEVERNRSRSGSGSGNRSASRSWDVIGTAKAVAAATAKVSAKVAAENATKFVFKEGTKFFIKKGTTLVWKKVPVVGLGCAAVCGLLRLYNGDPGGAVGEVISGAASCIPIVGTVASIGVDVLLCTHDMAK